MVNPWTEDGKDEAEAEAEADGDADNNSARPSTLCTAPIEYDSGEKVVGVHAHILEKKGYKEGCLLKKKGANTGFVCVLCSYFTQ